MPAGARIPKSRTEFPMLLIQQKELMKCYQGSASKGLENALFSCTISPLLLTCRRILLTKDLSACLRLIIPWALLSAEKAQQEQQQNVESKSLNNVGFSCWWITFTTQLTKMIPFKIFIQQHNPERSGIYFPWPFQLFIWQLKMAEGPFKRTSKF